MKNTHATKSLLAISAFLSMTACVDNDYDLSDIESTARIEVKDLVIPINLNSITLDDIIDIEKGDVLQIVDGQYAIIKEDAVNAEEIIIPAVTVKAPQIDPSNTLVYAENVNHSGSALKVGDAALRFPLQSVPTDCKYSTSNVSDYIVNITSCESEVSIGLTVSLVEGKGLVKGCDFSDIVFQLPKGLVMTAPDGWTYDADSGELKSEHIRAEGYSIELNLNVNGIDFSKMNYTYTNPTLSIEEQIYLKSGYATISPNDINISLGDFPTTLTLRTEYNLSDINVTSFTGKIKYDVKDVNIPDVNLNDLPDVLSQEGTNIMITNPCLYLQFNNPVQHYNLKAQSGLSLTAVRQNEADKVYGLNPGELIVINANHPSGIYNFCLSPKMPASIDPEFTDAEHVGYSALSNVLSGNGMPQSIRVNLINPQLPVQNVSEFPLGTNIGSIDGKYKLVAPFNFMDGSKVVYSHDMDGWNDDELDKITITTLEITMKASTDVPIALDFTGYPIDVNGNQINSVEITGAKIDANAQNQEITLRITGEIQHLDGIRYTATATVAPNSPTLSPDMNIQLTDVRPVVSGYYEKEL